MDLRFIFWTIIATPIPALPLFTRIPPAGMPSPEVYADTALALPVFGHYQTAAVVPVLPVFGRFANCGSTTWTKPRAQSIVPSAGNCVGVTE